VSVAPRESRHRRGRAVLGDCRGLGLGKTERDRVVRACRMEPLWSPLVATGGNPRQIRPHPVAAKQAESCVTRGHGLPETFHGKQGVCGGLPPVAGGPLPAKEGVDSRPLGRLSIEPLTQTSHCSSIIQALLPARMRVHIRAHREGQERGRSRRPVMRSSSVWPAPAQSSTEDERTSLWWASLTALKGFYSFHCRGTWDWSCER
jgi:hypothetical protein